MNISCKSLIFNFSILRDLLNSFLSGAKKRKLSGNTIKFIQYIFYFASERIGDNIDKQATVDSFHICNWQCVCSLLFFFFLVY